MALTVFLQHSYDLILVPMFNPIGSVVRTLPIVSAHLPSAFLCLRDDSFLLFFCMKDTIVRKGGVDDFDIFIRSHSLAFIIVLE